MTQTMFRTFEEASREARKWDTWCGSTKVVRFNECWWIVVRQRPAFTR